MLDFALRNPGSYAANYGDFKSGFSGKGERSIGISHF